MIYVRNVQIIEIPNMHLLLIIFLFKTDFFFPIIDTFCIIFERVTLDGEDAHAVITMLGHSQTRRHLFI